MSDPLKPVPPQIGSVVNVDRMDSLDRQKLDPQIKLRLLCEEVKVHYGVDPRSGGFSIVARPRMILQLLIDIDLNSLTNQIRLEKPIIIGPVCGDRVGWWCDIPIIVRSTVVDDNIYCIKTTKIPESKRVDRQRAGQLRVAAHNRTLELLRES